MAVAALQGEIVSALRQNWRFAAICQFLFTFEEALELGGFQTQVCCTILETNIKALGSCLQAKPDELFILAFCTTSPVSDPG